MKAILLYIISLIFILPVLAQEENTTVYQAKRYIDINIKSQTKYNEKVEKLQKKTLSKLKKKEKRFEKKLKRKDSAAHANYQHHQVSFDSISRIKKPDSANLTKKSKHKVNSGIDSLKGVKKFLENKAHVTGDGPSITDGYDTQLNSLKGNASHADDVNGLIKQRTAYLKNIRTKKGGKVRGLKSIQKQTHYSNEKMKAYKQIADEPSAAEEKALEYLQGKEGFDSYLSYSEGNSMKSSSNMSIDDLEKMGFQTKRKMKAGLQKKLGGNLAPLQESLGGQVKEYQDNLQKAKDIKKTAKDTKTSIKQVRHTNKPDFKMNPMRGLPFAKRIEQQYNYQTTRATHDGKPAVFSFSAMAGFKHTPRLSYGTGIATSIGLGTNWNNIKFSFQGVGFRTYSAWQWQYGIGAYAGYERMYKKAIFVTATESIRPELSETPHNKEKYNEAVLIGLTKAYRINDKMYGSIQVLYDIWWKEKGLRNPIQLRFATIKK